MGVFGRAVLDGGERFEKFLGQGAGLTTGNLIVRALVMEHRQGRDHDGRTRAEDLFQLA
jgi:hypothetical protein